MPESIYGESTFIGETITGSSNLGSNHPVFFDLHTPIRNSHPGTVIVTGNLGKGKTFAISSLIADAAVKGKTCVALDPKGDLTHMKNLEGEIGRVDIWDLNSKGSAGVLDPFALYSDPKKQASLVEQVVNILVGETSQSSQTAVSHNIKDLITSGRNLSLTGLTERLRYSEKSEVRDVSSALTRIKNDNYAKLLFTPFSKESKRISLSQGVTVVTMVGLAEPPRGNAKPTDAQRVASAILFLITKMINELMHNTGNMPKALFIDEAWRFLRTEVGKNQVEEVARLGRSKNIALVLATQNIDDVNTDEIKNTIKTRFAFGCEYKEAVRVLTAMGLPNAGEAAEMLSKLEKGQCFMKDWMGRVSPMQFIQIRDDWTKKFNTNPGAKRQ